MTAILERLSREQVAAYWPVLKPYFVRACDAVTTATTPEEIYDAAMSDRRLIWAVLDPEQEPPLRAALSTGQWIDHDGMAVFIEALAGEAMTTWLPKCLPELERHAKAAGANRLRIKGRPGWSKVLRDYRLAAVTLEKVL